jgi:phosphoribosylformylglycinamidine synthase
MLFSESPTRFLLEVPPQHYAALADLVGGLPMGRLGEVGPGPGDPPDSPPSLTILGLDGSAVIDAPVARLKDEWQRPLRW